MTAVAVFGFTTINAQDDKTTGGFVEGDIYVSGSVGLNNSKFGDAKTNSFTFSPNVGYFISENIALELGLTIGSSENEAETKTSDLAASLGGIYFFTPANQFSFTLGAAVSYNTSKVEPNGGGETKFNGFGLGITPGVNYFVSDCIALRAFVGALSYTSGKVDGADDSLNRFGLNLNLSDINFGITYKF